MGVTAREWAREQASSLSAEHSTQRNTVQSEKNTSCLQSTKELVCADTAPSYGAEQKEELLGGS